MIPSVLSLLGFSASPPVAPGSAQGVMPFPHGFLESASPVATVPPPPPPPPAVGGDDYPYYGYAKGERKRRGLEWRKKPDLADKLRAAYTELRQEAPPEIRAEVSEAVRPYVETSSDQALPPIAALDWSALLESLQAVQAILAAYEEMLDDEDQAIATLLL